MDWFWKSKPPPIQESWNRIREWHEKHCPPGTLDLNTGASWDDIRAFEKAIGAELPEDVRNSFALHNGSRDKFLLIYGPLLSLEEAWKSWSFMEQTRKEGHWSGPDGEPCDRVRGVKFIHWTPLRIPLTDNSGNHVMVDLDPDRGGIRGQILKHDRTLGPELILATSWSEWLSTMAEELESGGWAYDKEAQTVAPKGYYGKFDY